MLGVVCHWLSKRTKKNGTVEVYNAMEERSLQLGRWRDGKYTDEQILQTYVHNAKMLAEMAPLISSKVGCFRVSSCILPLADQVPRELWDNELVKAQLAKAGAVFQKHNVRLTTHPGQFCVLSSDHDHVRKNAVRDLEVHAWVMDALGLPQTPYATINIHGGKSNAHQRLIDSICDLPDGVRKRLTLENDETTYSVVDLLDVSRKTGVPIVLDTHHHTFNTGDLTLEEAHSVACSTWPEGIKPLQHVSNTEPGLENGSFADRRKHSDYLHKIPEVQLEALRQDLVDVECEAKMKNFAVEKIKLDLGL